MSEDKGAATGELNDDDVPLQVPLVDPIKSSRDFIKSAVCEIRFPTLVEFEEKLPPDFHKPLRREYPLVEVGHRVQTGVDRSANELLHFLRSKNRRWTVSFRASAFALETDHYAGFDEFFRRLTAVVGAASPIVDSDFFTRIGLRYVNVIPIPDRELAEWVNPTVVGPVAEMTYGTLSRFRQEIRGLARSGRYHFRHGFPFSDDDPDLKYVLDFDFYRSEVDSSEVLDVVKRLHQECFSLFWWTIGPKAQAALLNAAPRASSAS